MVDTEGHIMHIDFGFMLSNAPGKGIKFEKAPFKFKKEYLDIIGGISSKGYKRFKKMMVDGIQALQEHADKLILLVEMMCLGQGDLPCFEGGENVIREMKDRIFPHGGN